MLNVGVLGLGYWGPKLARNWGVLSEAKLEWVCDLDPSRLGHVAELYPGVHASQDYHEVLESDVDAVCIATPVRSHYHLAMDALRAGKHILVEKPLASCVEQAGEIVREGERQGLVVMVGHTFVYNPAVTAMKEIIDAGALGRIYYINTTRVNLGLLQPDINVMWDLAPHDISILLHILQREPTEVSAQGQVYIQKDRHLQEVAYLTLRFPVDTLANVRVSWLDPVKTRRITVVGSKKMLVYDDIAESKIMLFDKGVDIPPYSDTLEEFSLSYRTGEGVPHPIQWEEPLKLECQHFVDCITHGRVSPSNGRIGLEVVRILETAQHSLLNGGGREAIGDTRGFCAHRTERGNGPRCKNLCLREFVWL